MVLPDPEGPRIAVKLPGLKIPSELFTITFYIFFFEHFPELGSGISATIDKCLHASSSGVAL